MLYLFNSAFRPKYIANVLNTLALPAQWINEFRYDPQVHIARATFEELERLKVGTFVVVIFVDRFGSAGYEYHPLRTGTFSRMYESAGRRYFAIKLDDFVYPRDPARFRRDLVATLPSLPRLTNNTPDERDDGHYVHVERSLLADEDDFFRGSKAWSKAVDALAHTKAFIDYDSAFFKVGLATENRRGLPAKTKTERHTSYFQLLRDQRYELTIEYRYPAQWADPKQVLSVNVETGENIKLLGASAFSLTATADTHRSLLVSKKYVEDPSSHISFKFTAHQDQKPVVGMDRSLPIALKDPPSFWLQISLAFVSLGLLNALLTIDYGAIDPLTLAAVWLKLTWLKVAVGGLQALVLLWIFRLIGRKFL